MNSVKPSEDITGLKVDLEKYKKKIEELDSNNRDLSMQWSKLSVQLRDKEATFHAKMSAKEIEMAYLAKQNAEYKKMYEEMRSKLLLEASEVKVYNRLITPEVDRIRSMASEKFSSGAVSSSRQTIKFSRNSDGEMNGSSSDEESSKTIKVSQTMTKTATAQKVTKEAVQHSSSTAAVAKKN